MSNGTVARRIAINLKFQFSDKRCADALLLSERWEACMLITLSGLFRGVFRGLEASFVAGLPHNVSCRDRDRRPWPPTLLQPPVNPYPPRNTLLTIWEIKIAKTEKYVFLRSKPASLLPHPPTGGPPSQHISSPCTPFKRLIHFSSPLQLNMLVFWTFTQPKTYKLG